nr:hypothetical protein Hi04_10k_c4637_00026 [uncultured bacterium]
MALYNKPTGTWFAIFLNSGCGQTGIGAWRSTTPWDPASWTAGPCIHNSSADDRESAWSDNNPASPFYGRMYVSWNDFARGQGLFVRYSTDNGATWSDERQLAPGTPLIRNVEITGDLATGDVYVAGMNEGGGGLANRSNVVYRSTDGGNTWTNTYTGPAFPGPGRALNGYFACMYPSPSPGYWTYMGWGQIAAYNHVVHLDYGQCGGDNPCSNAADHGNVFYIRSTDSGVTFSAPLQLNTDTGRAAQWEPNLSVSPSGTVFATWYDERDGATCTAGVNTPCYRMYSRKSNDNGVTWQADAPLSDVVSPLPAQVDPSVRSSYAGDYDYGTAIATKHLTCWDDGRVAINGFQQQDIFTDTELVGPTATPTATATTTPTPTPTPRATPTPRSTPAPRPRPTPPPRP